MVYYTLVCVCSFSVDIPSGQIRTTGAKYSGRHQLCETCSRRLKEVKGKQYTCLPGLQCHTCYRQLQRSTPSLSSSDTQSELVLPPSKRIRRETKSDPGEPIKFTRKRTRAHPPPTIPITKKMRVKIAAPGDASLLLDILQIRRLQLIEAEKNGTVTQSVVNLFNSFIAVFD